MKKIIFFLSVAAILLQASNFRDGMLFYKDSNFKEAKESFLRAINKDNSIQANFMLGKMYLYGEGMPPERDKAIKYLKISVNAGNLRAKCYLSEAYLRNNTNKEEAVTLLEDGLKKNLTECKRIARIYNITIDKKAEK
ncbi:tetratricopeptide repeat protein [Sulfurospirillum sp. 1612]|uniref:tetratricopeptide repeat protein n=1 Tax=Sulfurospirillum sp. 1612 TaxID=3094835 RepID=UPI002F925B67